MLYIFDEVDSITDDIPKNMISLLSKDRYDKVQKLGTPLKKKASAAVYLLLRLALIEIYGIDETVEFEYTLNGKPILRDYPHIYFNLSHSKNTAACVVSDFEVGVDIQHITPPSDRVAKKVLTKSEYAAFKKSTSPDRFFCKLWVIKESYLKKTGQGLLTDLSDLSTENVTNKTIIEGNNYFCCVCGPEMQVKFIGRHNIEQLYN